MIKVKIKTESNFGAKLDTISDLLFFIVMFKVMHLLLFLMVNLVI